MRLKILKGNRVLVDNIRILRKDELFEYLNEEFDRKNNIHSMEIP